MPINLRDNYKDKEILEKLYASMSATNKDADRKMRIFEDWLEGDSFTTLSKTYDRTVERMRQIVTKMRYKYDFIKRTTEADPLEIYKQNFNVRIVNALMRKGLRSMNDLTEMTESNFRKIRNLGKSSQEIIINRMIELGLQFKHEEESVNEEPVEETETETSKMERMYEEYNSRCNISELASTNESVDLHCEDGEWTYECPLHKALSEIINSLIETIDKIDIIRRDNYDKDGYELMGLHIDFKKSQMIYETQLCGIPLFTIIIPAAIIPSQRDAIIEHTKKIAKKYNFDVKFINSEEIVYPVISRPTNITVDRLSQIDSAFRMDFPVEPYVVK